MPLIIGDLHGNIKFYQQVKESTDKKLILIGDLVDSFEYTRTEQKALLELVLDDIESGRTKCIFGNHELSYLVRGMECSGRSSDFERTVIRPLAAKMWKLMEPYIWDCSNKILITHAGLNLRLLKDGTGFKSFDQLGDKLINNVLPFLETSWKTGSRSLLLNIGRSRGGLDPVGGIFWSDYNLDFSPIPGLSQIFGHTPDKDIRQKDNNWCIDCLLHTKKVLYLDKGKIEVISYG